MTLLARRDRPPDNAAVQDDDLLARLDKLQDAANAASGHARNVYVTFLLFGVYLAIIFGSTTHEQLLRESPVTLPLLNVGLPLFGFYWVAPALFVLLHLNLLLQLYLLSGKLHRFDRALGEAIATGLLDKERANDRRAQLYPFPFSQMLVGRQHGRSMRFLLWLMVWLTVLVLPVVLLLMGQVRFLPYHDAWTTMWQRLMVLADVLLLLIFWRAIRHPGDRLLWHPGRWIWHQAKVMLPALVVLGFSFLIFTFPGDYPTGKGRFGDPMEEALLDEDGWLAWASPRSWRVEDRGSRLTFWPTQLVFESMPFLQRNLLVRDVNLVASWPTQSQIDQFGQDLAWQNFGKPPDLRDRDLRYADLWASILARGDFRNANLQDAGLLGANLQGAVLRFANFQGAFLAGASLQGAKLHGADFQGAALALAKLQGANLRDTDLQGAELAASNLQGANLQRANLRGVNLRASNLQGANLQGANLQGADLRMANLQGADLVEADLQGTDLRGARLWRVLLDTDADLSFRWNLADLRGVDVEPIEDLDAWVEQATIGDEETSTKVAQALRAALKNDDRSEVPRFPVTWSSAPPAVMFDPNDRVAKMLGWSERRWQTADAYDQDLASFLGELACREGEGAHVAEGLGRRASSDDRRVRRLYAQRLAARLIGDDCAPAAELPDRLRAQLEWLATQWR